MLRQNGTSLIEVLISVVILSIGLLGIAALQMSFLRYNQSAQLRSIAIAQANNMADRLRANITGVKGGFYSSVSGTPSIPSCTTGACNASQIAQRDAGQWNTSNAQLLPSGQGTVVANGNRYIITLRWDSSRSGVTGTGCSGDESVDLDCFIVEVQL